MTRIFLRALVLAPIIMLLSSCVGLPVYVPSANTPTSQVKLSPNMADDSLGMCDSSGAYQLKPENGHITVPANRRVRIWRAFFASGYRVTYHCAPGISFTPDPNVSYYADFEIRAERCTLLVYRQNPASRTGLGLEPSIGRDLCPATK